MREDAESSSEEIVIQKCAPSKEGGFEEDGEEEKGVRKREEKACKGEYIAKKHAEDKAFKARLYRQWSLGMIQVLMSHNALELEIFKDRATHITSRVEFLEVRETTTTLG